jgi:hypothetical protein
MTGNDDIGENKKNKIKETERGDERENGRKER